MASRLMPSQKQNNPVLPWVFAIIAAPFLWGWLLVRLWVPMGGQAEPASLAIAAGVLTAAALFPTAFFRAGERLLALPRLWQTLLAGLAAFALGYCFDVSLSMPAAPVEFPGMPVELLCHVGNGLVFTVIVLALCHAGRELLGLGRVDWKQMLFIFLCLNAVTAIYAFTSRTVYVWDSAGYWAIARSLAAEELNYEHLVRILESTLTQDYNQLLALPISLVMRFFGGSRTVFLFALSNFYTFPALWGLAAMARERKWSGLVLVGLFPMLGYTGLVGFVDVAAAALGIWAVVIYTSDRPAVSRGIFSGALLVGSFLLRRYFFFFAASFGVAALVQKLVCERKKWADFAALFGSCAVCSLTFTYQFLLDKVLDTNYRDLYSAYDLGLKTDIFLICRYFGLILLIIILLSALYGLRRQEDRPKLVLGLVQVAVCFAAFIAVQSHGQQHLLIYLPAVALLAVTALSAAPQFWSAIFAIITAVNCFIYKVQPVSIASLRLPALLPSFQFYGPQRADIDELLALSDYIDGLSATEPHTAVVMASSFLLNSDTLTNLRPSLGLGDPQCRTTIQYHGTVDKRDAFNWNTPTADYMIVGDPVQVHLGEENQRIMTILAYDVLEHTGPGEAYEPLPETFQLSDGVTVRVYQRVRPWSYEEYLSISDRLTGYYPDYADLYALPAWMVEAHEKENS